MSAILEFVNFIKASSTPEEKIALAGAARDARFKEQVPAYQREQDKPKDWKELATQQRSSLPSAAVGALGSAASLATEYGGPAATAAAQQGSQMPQGPLTQGTGTAPGKASAFARQKGGQAPRLQGKTPSMSTKVRMTKPPKMAAPQQMPVGQKMEKDTPNISKLLKAVDEEYNIKGRPQRNVRGQKDKGDMKVTGKGVQNLQRIIVDRTKKSKGQEGTE